MTTRSHAWMPASPCGAGCLPTGAGAARRLTAAVRWTVLVGLLIAVLLVAVVPLPARLRPRVSREGARALLRCLGISVQVTDLRDRRGYDRGLLVVAPHVSWLDVLVLTTVAPSSFVARADLLDWGALGALARRMRVIPIARERLRTLPGVVDTIESRLRAGERVTVFPEGTTWCGRAGGSFRAATFEAAVRAECPVQPVALHYLDRAGDTTTAPAFVGDETMARSVRRLVRSRGGVAAVTLAPLEWPGPDRRDLAARCERAARPAGALPHDLYETPAGAPAPR